MRPYEVMIIFDPTLDEPVLQAQVDRYSEIVSSRGATLGRVERWGRRRLAYEIRHNRDGYYVVMEAVAEPSTMADLERSLYLADEVLRHKVIRIPDAIAGRPRSAPPPPVIEEPGSSSSPNGPRGSGGPPRAGDTSGSGPAEPAPAPEPVAAAPEGDADPAAGTGDPVAAGEAAGDTSTSANGA